MGFPSIIQEKRAGRWRLKIRWKKANKILTIRTGIWCDKTCLYERLFVRCCNREFRSDVEDKKTKSKNGNPWGRDIGHIPRSTPHL